MTKTQEHFAIEEAQSEIRTRVLEIRATAESDMTPALRTERETLDKKYADGEIKFRASLKGLRVEQEQGVTSIDAEARALQTLTAKASVGDIYAAVVERRQTVGATAELQEHFSTGPHSIPLDLLRVEHRAITPGPTNTGADEQPVLGPVFAEGDAAFLSVAEVRVPPGDSVHPVLTTRPTVGGPHTDSTSVAETTGAYSAASLSPGRLQCSFFYRRTDASRFRGMADSLRAALNGALSESLDKEIQDQIITDVARVDRGSVSDYSHYKSLVTSRVDGRFAASEADVRVVLGTGTFVHANTVYRANETAESAVDAMRRMSGGVRVSALVAGVSGNKQDVIVRRGMRRDAVTALWESGVQLIVDEISGSKKGEITITAVQLAAFKILRADAFARLQTQHA